MEIKVGTTATAKFDLPICSKGERAVCYAVDEISGRPSYGFVFAQGKYDGFSPEDAMIMLDLVGHADTCAWYKFTNVGKLSEDYIRGRFDEWLNPERHDRKIEHLRPKSMEGRASPHTGGTGANLPPAAKAVLVDHLKPKEDPSNPDTSAAAGFEIPAAFIATPGLTLERDLADIFAKYPAGEVLVVLSKCLGCMAAMTAKPELRAELMAQLKMHMDMHHQLASDFKDSGFADKAIAIMFGKPKA